MTQNAIPKLAVSGKSSVVPVINVVSHCLFYLIQKGIRKIQFSDTFLI